MSVCWLVCFIFLHWEYTVSVFKFKLDKKTKLTAILLALAWAGQAQACESEPYLGSICYTAANYCPSPTYALANGSTLAISGNNALYALLGIVYGGDGRSTFMLPNLQGRSVIGSGQGAGLSFTSLGEMVGAESTTLTVANLAAHTHGFTAGGGSAAQVLPVTVTVGLDASTSDGTSSTPTNGSMIAKVPPITAPGGGDSFDAKIWNTSPAVSGGTVAVGGLTASGTVTIPASAGGGTVGVTGNNQPVSTRSPALALTACIAVQGLFPNRP